VKSTVYMEDWSFVHCCLFLILLFRLYLYFVFILILAYSYIFFLFGTRGNILFLSHQIMQEFYIYASIKFSMMRITAAKWA
jgi:hypothetical protein